MWIELVKAAAELVRAMAWPIAVVIVALSFKPGLLSALPSLFRGRFEVEGLGFKAKIDAAEQQGAGVNPATEKLPETPAPLPPPRPAVNIIETRLRDQLKGIDAGKRKSVLVCALAGSRLEAGHEFTTDIREPDCSAKAVERSRPRYG